MWQKFKNYVQKKWQSFLALFKSNKSEAEKQKFTKAMDMGVTVAKMKETQTAAALQQQGLEKVIDAAKKIADDDKASKLDKQNVRQEHKKDKSQPKAETTTDEESVEPTEKPKKGFFGSLFKKTTKPEKQAFKDTVVVSKKLQDIPTNIEKKFQNYETSAGSAISKAKQNQKGLNKLAAGIENSKEKSADLVALTQQLKDQAEAGSKTKIFGIF